MIIQHNCQTFFPQHFCSLKLCLLFVFLAIQFVLSDEFSHLRPEQRLALLHVSKGQMSDTLQIPVTENEVPP